MRGTQILLLTVFIFQLSFGQTPEEQMNDTEAGKETELMEFLQTFRENPLNINQASVTDLLQFPFITSDLARRIIRVREKQKHFSSLADLLSIPGIDPTLVSRLQPFITIQPVRPGWKISLRSRWQSQFELSRAFQEGKYQGTGIKNYQRIDMDWGKKIRMGMLSEKDPGENNWADWHSQYIQFSPGIFFSTILLGDYTIEQGQGLVLWSPYGYSKGPNVIFPVQKHAQGIKSYRSIDENAHSRGVAAERIQGNWHSLLWYSDSQKDANLAKNGLVRSLNGSGYHRDSSETKIKGNLREKNTGFSLSRVQTQYTAGISYLSIQYNRSFAGNDSTGFLKGFRGNHNSIYSFFYQCHWAGLNFFGEMAQSQSGGKGNIHGFILEEENTQVTVTFRKCDTHFFSPHGNVFGENNGLAGNETGWYLGIHNQITKSIRVNLYYDQFRLPVPTSTPFPVKGNEEFLETQIQSDQKNSITIRIKQKEKEITKLAGSDNRMSTRIQRNYRIQWDQFLGKINLRTRWERVEVRSSESGRNDRGYLLYQDLHWSPYRRWILGARVTYFQTDNYESRIYQYENDLSGVFGNNLFYGRGTKWYFLITVRPVSWLGIQIKYSDFYRDDVDSIGSGDDQTYSPQLRKWGIQFEYFY